MEQTGDNVTPISEGRREQAIDTLLSRLGISDQMIENLRSSIQDVDIDEYLNTAREYLKAGSTKAKTYAKENPGKVIAGAAVLAIGAGLLIASLRNRD